MSASETTLEMVQRHTRQGLVMIARQRALIVRQRADGHATDAAEALLAQFLDVQKLHEAHLERALREAKK